MLILPRLALLAVLFPALQAMTRHPEPAVFLAVLALLSALHGMSGAALIVLLVESFPRALRSTGFPWSMRPASPRSAAPRRSW